MTAAAGKWSTIFTSGYDDEMLTGDLSATFEKDPRKPEKQTGFIMYDNSGVTKSQHF